MGTGKKSSKGGSGCGLFIGLTIIVAIGVFTGTLPYILVIGAACLIVALMSLLIYLVIQHDNKKKREKMISAANIRDLSPIQYEEYIALKLKKLGYKNVQTTKASGDFGADIICRHKKGKKICIQCKHYSQPVGVQAVQEVLGARAYYKCDEAWVCASNDYTAAAQEMAKKTGVKLYTIK